MTMKIELELHREGNLLLLDSNDIYSYIGETTNADLELAYYVDEWCKYLNYPLLHNDDMKFADATYAKMEGWITGYNFAKKIDAKDENGVVVFRHGKHTITLNKPFKF